MVQRSRGRVGRNYQGLTFKQAFNEAQRPKRIAAESWRLWNELAATVQTHQQVLVDRDDARFNRKDQYHEALGAMLAPFLKAMVNSGKVHQLAELIDAASDDGSTCDDVNAGRKTVRVVR